MKRRSFITAGMVLALILFHWWVPAGADMRDFPVGSIIIPADSCWQPNTDPSNTLNNVTSPDPNCDSDFNDRSVFQMYGLIYSLLDTGDPEGTCTFPDPLNPGNELPSLQAIKFGICQRLKIYWVIDKDKTDPQAPDLALTDAAQDPIVNVYNSTAITGAGNPSTPVEYRGGVFVIDANDIYDLGKTPTGDLNDCRESGKMDLLCAMRTSFPEVKLHKVNIPFSGNVDKVLVGRPPKVAVLNEGASDVLEDYIKASGEFPWKGQVFEYVTARDVIAGCLQDPIPTSCNTYRQSKGRSVLLQPFQLLWAPHWIVEDKWADGSTPTQAEQDEVVQEIRDFLERGNAGFFECASIESLEGSRSADGRKSAGISVTKGGFLIDKDETVPRIETNGGCSDTKGCNETVNDPTDSFVVYEDTPFWLVQCGGWRYDATGGHVHNMRPFPPASGYKYHTTLLADDPNTTVDDRFVGTALTRFIHDDPAEVDYSPSSDYYVYDYLVGGRINGAPSQGYVVYFPGHKYIKCQNNSSSAYPPIRFIDIELSEDFSVTPSTDVEIEIVHASCTKGVNCPRVYFDTATQDGGISSDGYISVSAEYAEYDPASHVISGIFFSSMFDDTSLAQLEIVDIVVYYDGDTDDDGLLDRGVVSVTDTAAGNLCTLVPPIGGASNHPGRDTTSCMSSGVSANNVSLHFSGDVYSNPGDQIIMSIDPSVPGASATFTLNPPFPPGGTGTIASADGLVLDLTSAYYDRATSTLFDVKIINGCADKTVNEIEFTFPDSGGTITLDEVYNHTTGEMICTPGAPSTATCSGSGGGGGSANEESIEMEIEFKERPYGTTDIVIEADYACVAGCSSSGTVTVTYDVSNPPGASAVSGDSYFGIDASAAQWDAGSADRKKLRNIMLISKDDTNEIEITRLKITFENKNPNNRTQKIKKVKDRTNNADIWTCGQDASPAECSGLHYRINGTGGGGGGGVSWSYTVPGAACGGGSYYIGPSVSGCDIDWNSSNTCGIKYVLNTLLALKFQLTSSEFTKTQPIVKDNIMYKAFYDYPVYRGHLTKAKVPTDTQDYQLLWDAADSVPAAGTSGFPLGPVDPTAANPVRYIFTNQPGTNTIISFDPTNASALRSYLGVPTDNDATVLINLVRGREGATTGDAYGSTSDCSSSPDGNPDLFGCGEVTDKLWAIENSAPALVTPSKLVSGGTTRDIVVYAGAHDGMLHAFLSERWDPTANGGTGAYVEGNGLEIWAYIPSTLLGALQNQPFTVEDMADYSNFEPAVTVDGALAVSDFFIDVIDNLGNFNPGHGDGEREWRTLLAGTANLRNTSNVTQGAIFLLDVTDPYDPHLMWEKTYNETSDVDVSGNPVCGYDEGDGTYKRNCNMGTSKGVAIGRVQIGAGLQPVIFAVTNWVKKKNPLNWKQDCDVDATNCVQGISAFAIDFETGNILWEKRLPYLPDSQNLKNATDITATPGVPALMDMDNNGTSDFVVFGDHQGRLWALRTNDSEGMLGNETVTYGGSSITMPRPVLVITYSSDSGTDTDGDGKCDKSCEGIFTLDSDNKFTGDKKAGAEEPIGASVSVYKNVVVFGTGGADHASNERKYHILAVELSPDFGYRVLTYSQDDPATTSVDESLDYGEKVWAKPLIDKHLNVFFATAKSFYEVTGSGSVAGTTFDQMAEQTTGRVLVLNIRYEQSIELVASSTSDTGGFVGGLDADASHIYTSSIKNKTLSIGVDTTTTKISTHYIEDEPDHNLYVNEDFSVAVDEENPFKVLWWRKL